MDLLSYGLEGRCVSTILIPLAVGLVELAQTGVIAVGEGITQGE